MVSYDGLTILVTGHRGYIGSALVDRLSSFDCNLLLFRGDVSEFNDWKKNTNNCVDIIFHLAASELSHGLPNIKTLRREWEVNALAVFHLVDLCRKYTNTKIVFSSSTNIFGSAKSDLINEKEEITPLSVWAAHKLLAENYLKIYAELYGIKAITLRLPNVYGPTQKQDVADRMVVNKVIRQALRNGEVISYKNKDCLRDYVFIDDAIEALLAAGKVDANLCNGKSYVIGGGENSTINYAWKTISKFIKGTVIIMDEKSEIQPIEMRSYIGDYSEFTKLTGWKPDVKLEEGIQKTIAWIKENLDE